MSTFKMPRRPLRVLVLEDHPFQRAVAVKMLRQLGCREIFEAEDGVKALSILETIGTVDVAICDISMEGMDGLEFFQRIGESGCVGGVILCSSLPADLRRAVWEMAELLKLKVLGDIVKPLDAQSLQALLTNHLDQADPEEPEPLLEELPGDAEVKNALLKNQLVAYYQPKCDLTTGSVSGVEVFARWDHPSKGILPPAVFMSALERCGCLDEWLFRQMRQALSIKKQAGVRGRNLNLALNLQASQLANRRLTLEIRAILSFYGFSGSCLTFELTEGGLLEAPVNTLENLIRIRMMGCSLSIDDFGAGFSSLQRLCHLPFNEIKLDAGFVRGLKREPRCQAAISSTLSLGKALGMSVVVEGVETEEQRLQLLALGGQQGQGYLYARPMNGADLLEWLKTAPIVL